MHHFQPEVTLFLNGALGDSLEITTTKSNFLAIYSQSRGSFLPFIIPLTVRSSEGKPLNYRLKLQSSQQYCRDKGELETSLLGVSTTLDGNKFSVINSGLPGSQGIPITTIHSEKKHFIRVSFIDLDQKDVEQECYGTFILIAETSLI